MAKVTIETPPAGVWRWLLRRQLDGRNYRFLYRYNVRAGAWYLDIAGDDGVAAVRGMKMNLGTDKLAPFKYKNIPQGSLDVVDSSGEGIEPDLQAFGERVLVEYTPPEDPEPIELQPFPPV